jgi:CRP/FNR family transcriptional regulator, cyclic AMP receptor protein
VSIMDDVDLLRRIPMFAKIDPAKLKLLAFTSERVVFEAGQELFHQGDSGDAAYIIVEGSTEVLLDSPQGPVAVARLGTNSLVGDMAILCDMPRTATVKATTPVTTLKISKDLFFRMVTDFPSMGIEVMRELAYRLEKTTAELRDAKARLGA